MQYSRNVEETFPVEKFVIPVFWKYSIIILNIPALFSKCQGNHSASRVRFPSSSEIFNEYFQYFCNVPWMSREHPMLPWMFSQLLPTTPLCWYALTWPIVILSEERICFKSVLFLWVYYSYKRTFLMSVFFMDVPFLWTNISYERTCLVSVPFLWVYFYKRPLFISAPFLRAYIPYELTILISVLFLRMYRFYECTFFLSEPFNEPTFHISVPFLWANSAHFRKEPASPSKASSLLAAQETEAIVLTDGNCRVYMTSRLNRI